MIVLQPSLFDSPMLPRSDLISAKPVIPVIETWPPPDWLNVSEMAVEIGWSESVFVTTGLHDAIRHKDEFLWEVLWTARYHLVDLGDHPAGFTLSLGGHEYRFVASWVEHFGFLVRIETEQP